MNCGRTVPHKVPSFIIINETAFESNTVAFLLNHVSLILHNQDKYKHEQGHTNPASLSNSGWRLALHECRSPSSKLAISN